MKNNLIIPYQIWQIKNAIEIGFLLKADVIQLLRKFR